jgi:signal transduction histidine kinase
MDDNRKELTQTPLLPAMGTHRLLQSKSKERWLLCGLICGIAVFLGCSIATYFSESVSLGLLTLSFLSCTLLLLYSLLGESAKNRELMSSCQETRKLVARVLNAHDEERRQISRELQDDIGQRLTAVLISLKVVSRHLSANSANKEAQKELALLASSVSSLMKRMDWLSQQLHPSLVDYMGLGGALALLCRETECRHQVKVELSGCELLDHISAESARCLFSVAKEALGNAMRHSRSKHASVELTNHDGYGQLRVKDSGCGFDTKLCRQQRGFGIMRMEERVRALNGAMRIHSNPKNGTEVVARVPLGLKTARDAGGT